MNYIMKTLDLRPYVLNIMGVADKYRPEMLRFGYFSDYAIAKYVRRKHRTLFGGYFPTYEIVPFRNRAPNLKLSTFTPQDRKLMEQEIAVELERMVHEIEKHKLVPNARILQILSALSESVILTGPGLAHKAKVSNDTADRWLRKMCERELLHKFHFHGLNQYSPRGILAIIDKNIK
jgi:hypothetical protein